MRASSSAGRRASVRGRASRRPPEPCKSQRRPSGQLHEAGHQMATLTNCTAIPTRSTDERFWKELYDKVPKGAFVDDLGKGIQVGPDFLVSPDIWWALQDRCEAHVGGPLERLCGFSIAVSSWLPSGSIAGGTDRGRRMIREMKERQRRETQKGKKWVWHALFMAWASI